MNIRKLMVKMLENWPIKVLCIVIAIILFIFHRMSLFETRFFSVPLHIEHLGSMIPSNSYQNTIRVSIRGESNTIYSVLESDIEAYVDMSNYQSRGTYLVPVQWRSRLNSHGLDALEITVDPMEISLVIDQRISKVVPLMANFQGQIDTAYAMTSYSISPDHVIIDGPAEMMTGINELYTDLIDLGGQRSSFNETVNIVNINPLISIRGEGRVEFSAIISRIVPVRNISMVPIAINGLEADLRAEIDTFYVSLNLESDNQELLDSFLIDPEFVRIDCSGILDAGTYILNIITGTVPGISFSTDPYEVTVRIFEAGE